MRPRVRAAAAKRRRTRAWLEEQTAHTGEERAVRRASGGSGAAGAAAPLTGWPGPGQPGLGPEGAGHPHQVLDQPKVLLHRREVPVGLRTHTQTHTHSMVAGRLGGASVLPAGGCRGTAADTGWRGRRRRGGMGGASATAPR